MDTTEALRSSDVPPLPRYPGLLTLLAFYIFSTESVDVAILETGMGGETDSTNVLTAPVATGISEIGLDHTRRLGSTLDKIAWHKAGILKQAVPAFSVPQPAAAEAVLRRRADEKGTEILFVDDEFLIANNINVSPNYGFQRHNASLALQLAKTYLLQSTAPRSIDPHAAKCLERTVLPARFETIETKHIRWVLSIAHNNMSVDSACQVFLDEIGRYGQRGVDWRIH